MKENKYDDPDFFRRYSEMPRSTQGLEAAGEWPALEKLLPDMKGLRVLDLGCGYGWHCRYTADHGAAEVVGVDLSEKMLERARADTHQPQVRYVRSAIEDIDFPADSFDLALSSLAFHYVVLFDQAIGKVASCLRPGGKFVFSIEHPIFTAQGTQDWYRGPDGETLHWPVDHYFREDERSSVFLGATVTKHHKTMTSIVNTVLDHGFRLDRLVEPTPPERLADHPDMVNEFRRPMMLLLAATKM
ncbi:MAG: class I SAM-dependent methyltransferase [Planctomycetaceae bacterium]|nr:class I SAM-dependent methyltransferase [Planctomycetaceae bacterium]